MWDMIAWDHFDKCVDVCVKKCKILHLKGKSIFQL